MINNYMDYKDYLEREQYLKDLNAQGMSLIFKKNWLKFSLGIGSIVIGLIPNGLGIIFYPLGFYLLGISTADLFIYKERIINKIKLKWRVFALRFGFKNE